MTHFLIALILVACACSIAVPVLIAATWPLRENSRLKRQNADLLNRLQTWRHDCLNALDENDRLLAENGALRQDVGRLNGHPALREISTFDQWEQHVADALAQTERAAWRQLTPLAEVLPIRASGSVPEQRDGSVS